jgi:hypothetical protein
MKISLKDLYVRVSDMYDQTVTDVPLNICILNEDGTATNFSVDQLYMFFTGGPDGDTVANVVLKPRG